MALLAVTGRRACGQCGCHGGELAAKTIILLLLRQDKRFDDNRCHKPIRF
jgi:hypothetical protein